MGQSLREHSIIKSISPAILKCEYLYGGCEEIEQGEDSSLLIRFEKS